MSQENDTKQALSIVLCTDESSWINHYVPDAQEAWKKLGHDVHWVHSSTGQLSGDICFYLSYSRIVDSNALGRFRNNLVVHESALPLGRGWSP